MTASLILAAAAVAAILILPIDRVAGPIAELGRVTQPPIYLGVPVRQAPARPDSVFDVAMTAYSVGDYAASAAELEEAIGAGADPSASLFFLGASLLMAGSGSEAADAFRAVLGAGASPYVAEAHYYLAKILLRSGAVDEALASLEAASEETGIVANQAKALADSVRAVARQ